MQAHESNLLIVNWKTSYNLKIDPIIIKKKKKPGRRATAAA